MHAVVVTSTDKCFKTVHVNGFFWYFPQYIYHIDENLPDFLCARFFILLLDMVTVTLVEALIFRDHGIADGNAEKPI